MTKRFEMESADPILKAQGVFEEVTGIVQGGWVGALDGNAFTLRGEPDLLEGKLCIRVTGHQSLSTSQWENWIKGALMRAGAMAADAEKIWGAGIYLQDMTSGGSIGRACKPYAIGMVMFLDEVMLAVENIQMFPVLAADFQKRIANKTFTARDLLQMLRSVTPLAGKGIAQTGGDQLYRDQTITGYGVK